MAKLTTLKFQAFPWHTNFNPHFHPGSQLLEMPAGAL